MPSNEIEKSLETFLPEKEECWQEFMGSKKHSLMVQISFSFGLIKTSLGNIMQSCNKKRNIGPSSLNLIGLLLGTVTLPSFISQLLFEDTGIR